MNLINLLVLGFQDPATPIAESIIQVHNYIFFILIGIVFFVGWLLVNVIIEFGLVSANYETILNLVKIKHINEVVILEVIWTVIPFFILFVIAYPSFILLYQTEASLPAEVCIQIIGRQWYWEYNLQGLVL